MNISLPEIVREEAAARRAAERMARRRAGYVPLAPRLGIVAYRDERGVSLSAGIQIASQVPPQAPPA